MAALYTKAPAMKSMVAVCLWDSGKFGPEQAPADRCIEPESGPHARVHGHHSRVEDCRGPGSLSSSERFAENPCRIRDEDDRHQQEKVEIEQPAIDAVEMAEDRMVVQPHDPDHHEADCIGRERWPSFAQLVRQRAVVARLGDGQDQQSDGNGKDAVAEGLQSLLVHLDIESDDSSLDAELSSSRPVCGADPCAARP